MAKSLKEILSKLPNAGVGSIDYNKFHTEVIEPFITGYFSLDFRLPKFFTDKNRYQDFVFKKVGDIINDYHLLNIFINNMRDKYGEYWIVKFIESISDNNDTVSIIEDNKFNIVEYNPSGITVSNTLTIKFRVDMDANIYRLFRIWTYTIYHPLLGFSLLKPEYYKKEEYTGALKLVVYKPNMQDVIDSVVYSYLLPVNLQTIHDMHTLEGQNKKTFDMQFRYLLGMPGVDISEGNPLLDFANESPNTFFA